MDTAKVVLHYLRNKTALTMSFQGYNMYIYFVLHRLIVFTIMMILNLADDQQVHCSQSHNFICRCECTHTETLSEAVKLLKAEYLLRAIDEHEMDQAILFCRTKLDCDNMEQYLMSHGGE